MAYDVYPLAMITFAALSLVLLGVIAHAVRAGNRQGAVQHREVLEVLAASRAPGPAVSPPVDWDPAPDLPSGGVSQALREVWARADRQTLEAAPAAQRKAWERLLVHLRALQEGATGTDWLTDPYGGDGPAVAIVGAQARSLTADVRSAAAASGLPVEFELLDGADGPEIWVRLLLHQAEWDDTPLPRTWTSRT